MRVVCAPRGSTRSESERKSWRAAGNKIANCELRIRSNDISICTFGILWLCFMLLNSTIENLCESRSWISVYVHICMYVNCEFWAFRLNIQLFACLSLSLSLSLHSTFIRIKFCLSRFHVYLYAMSHFFAHKVTTSYEPQPAFFSLIHLSPSIYIYTPYIFTRQTEIYKTYNAIELGACCFYTAAERMEPFALDWIPCCWFLLVLYSMYTVTIGNGKNTLTLTQPYTTNRKSGRRSASCVTHRNIHGCINSEFANLKSEFVLTRYDNTSLRQTYIRIYIPMMNFFSHM
jgi:hypothetical protein